MIATSQDPTVANGIWTLNHLHIPPHVRCGRRVTRNTSPLHSGIRTSTSLELRHSTCSGKWTVVEDPRTALMPCHVRSAAMQRSFPASESLSLVGPRSDVEPRRASAASSDRLIVVTTTPSVPVKCPGGERSVVRCRRATHALRRGHNTQKPLSEPIMRPPGR